MKISELKDRLQREGFTPDVYSIDGPLPAHEGLILEKLDALWTIYHIERGIRRELAFFTNEEEACDRMYELLTAHFRW